MKVALSAWSGMGNLGDDWILSVALEQLGAQVGCILVERSAEGPLTGAVPRIPWPHLGTWSAPKEIRKFNRSLADFADAVLFCGGGWLAGDQGLRTPGRWAVRLSTLRLPAGVFGLGVGPFSAPGSRRLARLAISQLHPVTVRTEADSRQLWRHDEGRPPVVGDLTLLSNVQAVSARSDLPFLLSMPAPRDHWLPRGVTHHTYRTAVLTTAQRLAGGDPIACLPFDRSDTRFWADSMSVIPVSTVADGLEAVKSAPGLLAGRLHVGIAAVLARVPVAIVGYHHKFDLIRRMGGVVHGLGDLLTGRVDEVARTTPPIDADLATARAFWECLASLGTRL